MEVIVVSSRHPVVRFRDFVSVDRRFGWQKIVTSSTPSPWIFHVSASNVLLEHYMWRPGKGKIRVFLYFALETFQISGWRAKKKWKDRLQLQCPMPSPTPSSLLSWYSWQRSFSYGKLTLALWRMTMEWTVKETHTVGTNKEMKQKIVKINTFTRRGSTFNKPFKLIA